MGTNTATPKDLGQKTVFSILAAISFSHFVNDTLQSLIPAIYPLLNASFHLEFTQILLITLTYYSISLLQPMVGLYTDRKAVTYSLAAGMGFTLIGLVALSRAPNFTTLLMAVALVG